MSKLLEFKQPEQSKETRPKPEGLASVSYLNELREGHRKDKKPEKSSEPLTVEEVYDLLSINQVLPENIEALCRAEGIHEEAIPLLKIIAEQITKIKEYEEILQGKSSQNKQHDIIVRSLLKKIQILEEGATG